MSNSPIQISEFITNFYSFFPLLSQECTPWDLIDSLEKQLEKYGAAVTTESFKRESEALIHNMATVENNVTIKGKVIVESGCLIRSGAYLRGPIYLGPNVTIGANCEIKQSMIFENSSIAHLNYVGNSIIGENVNLEAGAILANHFNERKNKEITILHQGKTIETNVTKFGSVIGDGSKVGANSVLNPGTLLSRDTVVDRLTHVNQLKDYQTDRT
ncbi:LpxA family transferase [Fulvivirgaceae bacterium BMA12]|uniref:LpxA family transferase n=1 Tax=Agaribacillus aureus TaxID=3051825 RepID=A0ABT8LFC7_9BACT|nr:LpxA family transferase [Fulvivirgaceae bacterium BMA12]